jgi:pSer/pThr/pTyr-binding forkhead associated (FHA) protein
MRSASPARRTNVTEKSPKTVLLRPSANSQTGEELCAKLVVIDGHAPGLQLLLNRPEVTLGRRPDNDLVLESDAVSRRHGRITKEDTVYGIEDLESENGTAINGRPLKPREWRTLCHGDQLKLGDQQLVFLNPCGSGDQAGLPEISFDRDQVVAEVDALLGRLPDLQKKTRDNR